MSDAPAAAPAPKKKGGKLKFLAVGVLFAGLGAGLPVVIDVPALLGLNTAHAKTKDEKKKKKGHDDEKTVTVAFSDAVVNLAEDRMTRYLRVKIVLVIEHEAEAAFTEKLTKQKAVLKSWLLAHLSGKTLKDVSGTVGVNRLQREIFEKFEDVLYPDGHGPLKSVLFEEYVVQ